jgi:hypothetical protein
VVAQLEPDEHWRSYVCITLISRDNFILGIAARTESHYCEARPGIDTRGSKQWLRLQVLVRHNGHCINLNASVKRIQFPNTRTYDRSSDPPVVLAHCRNFSWAKNIGLNSCVFSRCRTWMRSHQLSVGEIVSMRIQICIQHGDYCQHNVDLKVCSISGTSLDDEMSARGMLSLSLSFRIWKHVRDDDGLVKLRTAYCQIVVQTVIVCAVSVSLTPSLKSW